MSIGPASFFGAELAEAIFPYSGRVFAFVNLFTPEYYFVTVLFRRPIGLGF